MLTSQFAHAPNRVTILLKIYYSKRSSCKLKTGNRVIKKYNISPLHHYRYLIVSRVKSISFEKYHCLLILLILYFLYTVFDLTD